MDLSRAIIKGDSAALNMAKTLLSQPALIGMTGSESEGSIFSTSINYPVYIPLEVNQHTQHGDAEVSENLIISTGENTKKFITDNVAPGPWTWSLSGYIPGVPALEKTNIFTPFVTFQREMLKKCFKNGQRMVYKDTDCNFYKNVIIQSLDISSNPDCQNKTPVQLTLKQIETINAAEAEQSEQEKTSTPAAGSEHGAAASAGTTSAARDSNLYTSVKSLFQ